jgi:hypothetical protein
MASSAWFDGELAIRSNHLSVFTPDGQPDEEDSVLALFTADKRSVVGASLRWAVVVGDDCRPALMLQSLPLAENSLMAKPQLRGDAPPIISLGSVPLACVMFDGGAAAGPVPIIACLEEERPAFAGDPLSARGAAARHGHLRPAGVPAILQGRGSLREEAQAGPAGLPLQAEGALCHPAAGGQGAQDAGDQTR